MKAVNAAENAWDNMPTLEYSELLDMSSDEAGQAALEGYLENLPAILRYTTTEAEKAFIVEEGGRRLLYSLDDTLRRNPKLLLATEDEVAAAMSEAAKPLSDLMGDEILARFRLPVLRVEDDAI
jgi:hypothetical protein